MAAPILAHFEKPVTVSVKGVVIDEYGDALVGVSIVIRVGGIVVQASTSDKGGGFAFENIALDVAIHSLEAQAPGYNPAKQELNIKPDLDGKTLNACLRLESTTIPNTDLATEADDEATHLSRFRTVRVFFATDRLEVPILQDDFRKAFANERASDGKLRFGTCEVSIPESHRIGILESPSIFKLQFRQDPNKHVALLSLTKLEPGDFFSKVSAAAESSGSCDAFVFVHGYSVTFAEALRRTAQIAFDLGFNGAPICYSWPSKGTYIGYAADETSVEWTEPHLLNFLNDLSAQRKIETIHLLAHSMGNRAVVGCLERIASTFSQSTPPTFRQAILAAPDIDAGVFENKAPLAAKSASRVTLYASSSDLPLHWSKDFHRYRRAGDTDEGILIVSGVDSIDASNVPSGFLGHSYYGDSRTLLSDIFELITKGTAPPRFGLRPEMIDGRLYWVFVP